MIEYKQGDIFNSKADILVCPVNTVGVMGKGLALQFREYNSSMYAQYQGVCISGLLDIGKPYLWASVDFFGKPYVLFFPTKRHWRRPSCIGYIHRGLVGLAEIWPGIIRDLDVISIAFPLLGCGLGGLEWDDVKPLMEIHLKRLCADVEIWHERSSDNL